MEDTAKYLVHADIVADGVVERSDVVGAIFGQTEGLLGDELDLRSLQRASKVGRINVEIDSENGQSFGQVTIATSLDRVEAAILAASLETIDRVGPCRSTVAVSRIEDVRAAKRRAVVERAKDLLGEFDESVLSTRELVEEVRESVRVEEITEYEGLPAGPRVASGDAVIVVEGRADVLTLLRYGIENAIAVEGTNVPEPVADLTAERTVTAFLDGDRGGDLILRELGQVGEIDHVAIAPSGRSVEDLTRREALAALRAKVAYTDVADAGNPRQAVAATDGNPWPAPDAEAEAGGSADGVESETGNTVNDVTIDPEDVSPPAEIAGFDAGAGGRRTDAVGETAPAARSEFDSSTGPADPAAEPNESSPAADGPASSTAEGSATVSSTEASSAGGSASGTEPNEPAESAGSVDASGATAEGNERSTDGDEAGESEESEDPEDAEEPETLRGHVRAVAGTDRVRLLDAAFETLAEAPIAEAFDAIAKAETDPTTVVLDGELTQRTLDIVAQRGVEQVIAREEGAFVKQPTSVRVRTAAELRSE